MHVSSRGEPFSPARPARGRGRVRARASAPGRGLGSSLVCFFFNDTATTEIYTLSLHDALPILVGGNGRTVYERVIAVGDAWIPRSEEHTSELQSRRDLVCRLLLEKKKKKH